MNRSSQYSCSLHPQIGFDRGYLRCVRYDWFVVQIIYLLIPFLPITIMYIAIVSVITRNTNYSKHVLVNATVIIFTSLIAFLPATITNAFAIPMPFEFAQIGTVTFYYLNTVVNPLVYFCMHPRARTAIKDWYSYIRETVSTNCQHLYDSISHSFSPVYQDFTELCRLIFYPFMVIFSTSKNSVSVESE